MNIEKIKQIERFAKDMWEGERLSAFDHSQMEKKLYVMDIVNVKIELIEKFKIKLIEFYQFF